MTLSCRRVKGGLLGLGWSSSLLKIDGWIEEQRWLFIRWSKNKKYGGQPASEGLVTAV